MLFSIYYQTNDINTVTMHLTFDEVKPWIKSYTNADLKIYQYIQIHIKIIS